MVLRVNRNTEQSVMARVDKSADCWLWTGSHTADNRPQVNFDGRHWYVYRLLYTWRRGAIPDGLTLDHTCLNGRCVNPDHCEPATNSENVQRGLAVRYAGRTACPRGHPYVLNKRPTPNGKHYCAECNREACRRRYWARKNQYASTVVEPRTE